MIQRSSTSNGLFVQVGATRDGLDPYLREARERGLTSVLVETPAYLELRQQLGRKSFDVELGVAEPQDPAQVCQALRELAPDVKLVLTGFERYAASAFSVANSLGLSSARGVRHRAFSPPDKSGQRALLAERAPELLQPGHLSLPSGASAKREELLGLVALKRLRYPLVVKPSDGGGGLGVFLVENEEQLGAAVDRLGGMSNYGGGDFAGLVVEEFIEGTEFSVQAMAFRGVATILTFCEKLIVRERSQKPGVMPGFREAAHIAQVGAAAPASMVALAQRCIEATGYSDGPFHIDFIRNANGDFFVEMGYRLSGGGIVGLVERTSGLRWGEQVFAVHLDGVAPREATRTDTVVGLITLASDDEVEFFRERRAAGDSIELVQLTAPVAMTVTKTSEAKELSSDRMRHIGFKARAFFESADSGEVRKHFRAGIRARLEHGLCVD